MHFVRRPGAARPIAGLLFAAALAACGPEPSGSVDVGPAEAPPVEAGLSGRRAVEEVAGVRRARFDGDACPVVRTDADGPSLWWIADGAVPVELPHAVDRADDGVFLRVERCRGFDGVGHVELRAGARALARWPAAWRPGPTELPPVVGAAWLRTAVADMGPWWARRAIRVVGELVLDGPHPPDVQVWLAVERAHWALAFAEGADAPFEATEAAWLRAADVARSTGLVTEVVRRLCAAAYFAIRRSAFDAAAEHLERARAVAGDDAVSLAQIAHNAGILAQSRSQWRAAEGHLSDAARFAARAGVHGLRAICTESQAIIASELGFHRRALALVEPLVDDPSLSPAARGRAALNAGLLLFRAMSRGAIARDPARVRARYADAERWIADPATRVHLRISQALLELDVGDRAAAQAHLSRIEGDGRGTDAAAPVALVAGAIALDEGSLDAAEARFAEAGRLAVEWWGDDGGDYGWRAALGRARVARARGALGEARRHVERAQARLERVAASTDPLASRVPFFDDRDELARLALSVALEQGDVEGAFTTADRSHGRVLRSMMWAIKSPHLTEAEGRRRDALRREVDRAEADARALRRRWRQAAHGKQERLGRDLAAAEARRRAAMNETAAFLDARLPKVDFASSTVRQALRPGEVIVLVADDLDGRVALWTDGETYVETELPTLLPGDLLPDDLRDVPSDDLLPDPPWPAEHVYVVDGGHPDVVRAAFRGAIDRPYSVSLLPVAALLAIPPRRPTTGPVVISDPDGGLPQASAEGRWLAGALPGARLLSGAEATVDAMRAALRSASVVHFSGHGKVMLDAPWSTHVVLAGGRRFDVFDVLSTSTGGGLAVLNSCETGSDVLTVREDVLGLPEALLVSGASAVVAADRVLPDAEARRFTELFYIHGGHRRPGAALRATMQALRDAGVPTWNAWRLVGRPTIAAPDFDEDDR